MLNNRLDRKRQKKSDKTAFLSDFFNLSNRKFFCRKDQFFGYEQLFLLLPSLCSKKKRKVVYTCIYSEILLTAGSALKTAAILISSFIGRTLP